MTKKLFKKLAILTGASALVMSQAFAATELTVYTAVEAEDLAR